MAFDPAANRLYKLVKIRVLERSLCDPPVALALSGGSMRTGRCAVSQWCKIAAGANMPWQQTHARI